MTKRKTVRVAAPLPTMSEAKAEPQEQELTWKEERFVEAYVETGNGAGSVRAARYTTIGAAARNIACELLAKPHIRAAVEAKKQEYRDMLSFDRNKALRMLAGMAGASLDDFCQVFDDPADPENYCGLGYKRFAIESAKKTTIRQEDGSEKETNEIRIISPGERRAAINDLWDKLGLDKGASERDRLTFLERFAELGAKLGRKDSGGERAGSS